mmetsp:Transcript_41450/g.130526  ORF Transcript_41450/g.130526 Transcript_41450/m.130526 type:complete len:206 (+) Transcript_41450:1186-1803(+)
MRMASSSRRISDIFDTHVSRFHYNVKTYTSTRAPRHDVEMSHKLIELFSAPAASLLPPAFTARQVIPSSCARTLLLAAFLSVRPHVIIPSASPATHCLPSLSTQVTPPPMQKVVTATSREDRRSTSSSTPSSLPISMLAAPAKVKQVNRCALEVHRTSPLALTSHSATCPSAESEPPRPLQDDKVTCFTSVSCSQTVETGVEERP